MIAIERLNVELETLHQINLLKASSENEKKLAELEKNQMRSLMGNVAHDLKTPLHSVEADLEMLILVISKIPLSIIEKAVASLQSPGSVKQAFNFDPQSIFKAMNATCKFMEMSINRSQDFMKASNNIVLLPALETFDLGAAISSAVTCVKHVLSDRLIKVNHFDESICAHLVSDKHWITENMLCLLSNAIKYGDKGHVDVHVEVIDAACGDVNILPGEKIIQSRTSGSIKSPTREINDCTAYSFVLAGSTGKNSMCKSEDKKKRMVLITVEDSGIGICEDARKKLFQPFVQAQRMAGGTGLGLYSLLKRVEALGGEVGVASRSDRKQGSMFWFTFPYRPDREAASLVAADLKASFGGSLSPERILSENNHPIIARHILLIDDSPSVLRVTSRFLLMNHHTVVTAPNGWAGLEILKETYGTPEQFDLVLTDMQMPVMDGIEATSRFRNFEEIEMDSVRTNSKDKRLLIVGMSANSDDETKQEALNAGVDYFVTKPFTYKALTSLLKNSEVKL
eukprot:CAMPEP_0119040854 /NCGR_PEP_ID=MMETSP1177-20130426/10890_1 /TAXON_ID=2985 /ORGANISM="Ochromonas sp, Strain CCMP1899" /LENGTH=511 /DNA_ID=CAMNT_0007006311 /DNA_START=1048 /DNA_END=2583 /DNA_ORIENTATION=+